MTHCLAIIHIAIKFHQDIPNGYLVMACIRIVWKKKNQREVTQKQRKGDQSFLYTKHCLNLMHTAIKFHRYSIRLPTYGTHKVSQKISLKGSN